MFENIKHLIELSSKYNIPTEDLLLLDLNLSGVKLNLQSRRVRFELESTNKNIFSLSHSRNISNFYLAIPTVDRVERYPFFRQIVPPLFPEKLRRIFGQETNPGNVIVVCTGYVNIFRGIFGATYDTKNWKFLGYSDGFSLDRNRNASVLELNRVNKDNLIKYIKNQLGLN